MLYILFRCHLAQVQDVHLVDKTVHCFLHGSEERCQYVIHVSSFLHPRTMATMTPDELDKMLAKLMQTQAETAATAAQTAMANQAVINEQLMAKMLSTMLEEAANNKAATAEATSAAAAAASAAAATAAAAPKENLKKKYQIKQSENKIDPKTFQRINKF